MSIKCPSCGHQIEEWYTLTAVLPVDVRTVWDAAVSKMRKEGIELPNSVRLQRGTAIEALCASYLAGP